MMKAPQANKTRFDDRIYVIGKTKLCIKHNTQIVSNIRGGRQLHRMLTGNESLSHLYLSLEPNFDTIISTQSLNTYWDALVLLCKNNFFFSCEAIP